MNFDFSEEQKMLRAVARKFLKENCSPGVVRRMLDGDAPYDEKLWKGICELDWPGTAVPESYGGIGYGYLELCVLAEELGRVIAPIPFSSSAYMAADRSMSTRLRPFFHQTKKRNVVQSGSGSRLPRTSVRRALAADRWLNGTR